MNRVAGSNQHRVGPSPGSLEMGARSVGRRTINSGASAAYRPEPWVMRALGDIDPRLALEWRPNGRPLNPYTGARMPDQIGCWRILVQYGNEEIHPVRLWPATMCDGRLVSYMRETHGRNLWVARNTTITRQTKKNLIEYMDAQDQKLEKARFDKWWNSIDHGKTHRAVHADSNSPKWRQNWNVPAQITGGG